MESGTVATNGERARRWARGLFWGAVLFVYAFRMAYVIAFPWIYSTSAAGEYYSTVDAWEKGRGFQVRYMRTPAYPVFLLAVSATAGVDNLALLQHAGYAAAAAVLGFLLLRMFPTTAGYAAAALFVLACGLWPSSFSTASSMIAESLQVPVFVLLILFMALWEKRPFARLAAGLGVAVALAVLVRPTNIVWALAAVPVLAVARRFRALGSIVAFCMVSFACVLPWMLENRKLHGTFTLSDMSGQALIQAYGHLVDMESPKNRPYKEAIRKDFQAYMASRGRMTPQDLAWAGTEVMWGEHSYLRTLSGKFNLGSRERDAVARELALEGVLRHPRAAWDLVAKKLGVFYFSTPYLLEESYLKFSESVPLVKFPALEKTFAFVCDRPWSEQWDGPTQARLYGKAGWITGPLRRLAPVFGYASVLVLWASILFFPFVLGGGRPFLGLFLFLFIHGYCVLVCCTAPPDTRYFQPVPVMACFLLCMEALSVPEFFGRFRPVFHPLSVDGGRSDDARA